MIAPASAALVSFGIAMFACVRYARVSQALWHVLAIGSRWIRKPPSACIPRSDM